MAINQNILTPLTLFSGSMTAYTVPAGVTQGQLIGLLTSSVPSYNPAFWSYKIKTDTTYVTSATATNINELQVNLTGSATTGYHLILGFYGIGCSSTTTAPRLGNAQSSLNDGDTVTLSPTTLTAIIGNWNGSATNATTNPSSDVNNFYLHRHIFIGKPNSSTATFTPTLAVSTAGAGITASMGPSVIFYRRFT